MDNLPPQEPTSPTLTPQPFKDWAECHAAIKKLPQPLGDKDCESLVHRIAASNASKHIAFELVSLIRTSKDSFGLRRLEPQLINLLGNGDEEPKLAAKPPSEASSWVYRELRDVKSMQGWKVFVTSGRHYWVWLAILKAESNKAVLVEALTALADCVEQCQNIQSDGKQKTTALNSSSAQWIIKILRAKTSGLDSLSTGLIESLFAIKSTADLTEGLRSQHGGLLSRIRSLEEQLVNESKERQTVESRLVSLQAQLNDALTLLESRTKELEEEKLHSTRQGGFNAVTKRETINQVMSVVRQTINHRLENIRGYADREKPNREEIVSLVDEIAKRLAKLEEVIDK